MISMEGKIAKVPEVEWMKTAKEGDLFALFKGMNIFYSLGANGIPSRHSIRIGVRKGKPICEHIEPWNDRHSFARLEMGYSWITIKTYRFAMDLRREHGHFAIRNMRGPFEYIYFEPHSLNITAYLACWILIGILYIKPIRIAY